MNYYLGILLFIMKSCDHETSSSFSSPEVVYVCLGEPLSLTCATKASILEWNITGEGDYGVRLVISTGVTDIRPLMVNNTTFTFSRESREPLNVTLSAVNVTMNFRIFCVSVPPGTTSIERVIQIIRMSRIKMYLRAVGLSTIEQSFGEDNVVLTVTLDLEGMHNIYGIIYGVSITSVSEHMKSVISSQNNASVQLTVSYNFEYNLSTFAMLCSHEIQSELIPLFYANCGSPTPPQYGYLNPYTSTLEGAEVNVTCLNGQQENLISHSICTREGNWSPDPLHLCSTNMSELAEFDPPRANHSNDTSSTTITAEVTSTASFGNTNSSATIIAVVTSTASFTIFLIVCGVLVIITALLMSRTSKHESTADEVHHPSNTPVAPTPIYESIFPMEFQEQNLELEENIAYGPLPIHKKGMATDPVDLNIS